MAMQSFWSVTYTGPHHGVFVKKLERLGQLHALEIERERFTYRDEKVEHASFFVRHPAENWQELVMQVLQTAQLIFPVWKVTIGGDARSKNALSGETARTLDGFEGEYHQQRLAGIRLVTWEINETQHYKRVSWLNGQQDRW